MKVVLGRRKRPGEEWVPYLRRCNATVRKLLTEWELPDLITLVSRRHHHWAGHLARRPQDLDVASHSVQADDAAGYSVQDDDLEGKADAVAAGFPYKRPAAKSGEDEQEDLDWNFCEQQLESCLAVMRENLASLTIPGEKRGGP